MSTTAYEPVDALADRPPIQHSAAWSMTSFGDVVGDDLEQLAAQVATAIRHCNELSRSAPALYNLDVQRDVLHLQARIGGLALQIADAQETLERMQPRIDTSPSSRKQLKLTLS